MKIFIFLSDSILSSILIKCNLFRSFKNVQICRHFGPPFAPVFPWFGMICDVDEGTPEFSMTYFACFTSVN